MTLLSPTQACDYLCENGVIRSPVTLRNLRVKGGGPPFHKFGNEVFYTVNRIGMGTLDRRPNGTPFCGTTVSARPGGAGRVSAARSGAADWLCGFSFETDS